MFALEHFGRELLAVARLEGQLLGSKGKSWFGGDCQIPVTKAGGWDLTIPYDRIATRVKGRDLAIPGERTTGRAENVAGRSAAEHAEFAEVPWIPQRSQRTLRLKEIIK